MPEEFFRTSHQDTIVLLQAPSFLEIAIATLLFFSSTPCLHVQGLTLQRIGLAAVLPEYITPRLILDSGEEGFHHSDDKEVQKRLETSRQGNCWKYVASQLLSTYFMSSILDAHLKSTRTCLSSQTFWQAINSAETQTRA